MKDAATDPKVKVGCTCAKSAFSPPLCLHSSCPPTCLLSDYNDVQVYFVKPHPIHTQLLLVATSIGLLVLRVEERQVSMAAYNPNL